MKPACAPHCSWSAGIGCLLPERYGSGLATSLKLDLGMSRTTQHRTALFSARLGGCGLAFCLLIAPTCARPKHSAKILPKAVAVATPTPAPSPPTVEFQTLMDRESVEQNQEIHVSLFVSNKSPITLTGLKLNFADSAFEKVDPAFPTSLAPFDSDTKVMVIKPLENAAFENHKLLFSLEYKWKSDSAEFRSAQATTAAVLVKRRFEEETKGFTGGTAAFFYLLLPIVPGILSYQFFHRLRKGEGPKVPSFSPEYVVPAFFLAVILSLIMLFAFK